MRKTIDDLGRITIEESDMRFGSYSSDEVFDIEESNIHKGMRQEGVQTAEFLLFKIKKNQPTVLIIEAKRTAPKVLNQTRIDKFVKTEKEKIKSETDITCFFDTLEKRLKHDDFFNDIKGKFRDTLALFVAMRLNRHKENSNELPQKFTQIDLSEICFEFVLIIKEQDPSWRQDLQNKVEKELNPILKIWNLSPTSVQVIDEARAKKRGLITNN